MQPSEIPLATEDTARARMRGSQLTRGRKFSAGELQLQLLWFLRSAPAHGYELARRFKELSLGFYSPSPGVLYPALAALEEQKLARAEPSGRRKDYRITPAGLAHLERHAAQAQSLIAVLRHAAKRMLWVEGPGDEAAAIEATGWLPGFVQARRELRAALLERDEAGHAEQRRIIAILRRATDEIRQSPTAAATPPSPDTQRDSR